MLDFLLNTIRSLVEFAGLGAALFAIVRGKQPDSLAERLAQPHARIDLAVGLACATGLSLVVSNAAVVSTANGESAPTAFLLILGIVAATSGAVVYGWYRQVQEQVVLLLAVAAWIVVVLAPGAPLGGVDAQEVPTARLSLSLVFTVALSSTAAFYTWGKQRAASPGSKRSTAPKRLASAAAVAVPLLSAWVVGEEERRRSAEDYGIAVLGDDTGRALLAKMRGLSVEQQHWFYQVASEVALTGHYFDAYRSGGVVGESEDKSVGNGFDKLSEPLALDFLRHRLAWIHPMPARGEGVLPLRLSGRTALLRRQSIAECRRRHLEQPQEKSGNIPGLHDDSGGCGASQPLQWFDPGPTADELAEVFKSAKLEPAAAMMAKQMERPSEEEASQAYAEYELVAARSFGIPTFRGYQRIVGLSPEAKVAFKRYFADTTLGEVRLQALAKFGMAGPATPTPSGAAKEESVAEQEGGAEQGDGEEEEERLGPGDSMVGGLEAEAVVEAEAQPDAVADVGGAAGGGSAPSVATSSCRRVREQLAMLARNEAEFSVHALAAKLKSGMPDSSGGSRGAAAEEGQEEDTLASLQSDMFTCAGGEQSLSDLADLLNERAPGFNPLPLLTESSLDVAWALVHRSTRQQRADIFAALHSPVCFASVAAKIDVEEWSRADVGVAVAIAREVCAQAPPEESKTSELGGALRLLSDFVALGQVSADAQEDVLQRISIAKYQPSEDTPDAFTRLVLEAEVYSAWLATSVAAVAFLPIFILCMLGGRWAAIRVHDRDRLISVASSELDGDGALHRIGTAVGLQGREGDLAHIHGLARRGWASIAVVGRRGVGKSRLLYELYRKAAGRGAAVAWIQSPTEFGETDFVRAAEEQLATNVEEAIARDLGAEPLRIREAHHQADSIMTWAWGVLLSAAVAIGGGLIVRDDSHLVENTLPLLIVFVPAVLALAAMLLHRATAQPLDLGSWLNRSSHANAQATLLYRDARAALDRASRKRSSMPGRVSMSDRVMGVGVGIVVLVILNMIFIDFFDLEMLVTELGVFVLSAIGAAVTYRLITRSDAIYTESQSETYMQTVREFRRFAHSVVRRTQAGALKLEERHPAVVICVDELDKIVGEQEMLDCIRKLKAVFEIEGVHYYVSLAEDALAKLELSGSRGKNEVDSAFDHVVLLEPLATTQGAELAAGYAGWDTGEPEPWFIASCSYGVPRDIMRRADELVESGLEDPIAWSRQRRGYLSQLLYRSGKIGRSAHESLSDADARRVAKFIAADAELVERTDGAVLEIWVLTLLQLAQPTLAAEGEQGWKAALETLRSAGYLVGLGRLRDVQQSLQRVHDRLLA